jgi:hypothetical protein
VVFCHFHGLRILAPWLFDHGIWRSGGRLDPLLRRHAYLPYVRELRASRQLVAAAGGAVPQRDTLRYQRVRACEALRMFWHRGLLAVTDSFVL